jgi:hypothetical protein
MSNALICSALGVRPDQWPPDHYAILGLPPGDVGAADVEGRVLDRMERLRRYQLAHPDAVTDAMNRLAQALVCLSDPAAKAAYDAGRRPIPVAAPQPIVEEEVSPPRPYPLAPPEPVAVAPVVRVPRRPAPRVPRRPWSEPTQARRPGHTEGDPRRRLYHRLGATRRLLAAWRDVGDFVAGQPRLREPGVAIEFVSALLELRERLAAEDAPPVGLPGQPGALVAALARQPLPLTTYRQFLPEQRTALATDWQAGEARLAEMYREMARAVRRHRRSAPRRAVRAAARALVTDRLDLTLFVLGLAALGLAILRAR